MNTFDRGALIRAGQNRAPSPATRPRRPSHSQEMREIMVKNIFKSAAIALVAGAAIAGGNVQAQQPAYVGPYGAVGQPLFYNYYTNGAGSTPAQLYVSPRPTPPFVGHTYFTYPPLLPHEYLDSHSKSWVRYEPSGRRTVTRASYWHHLGPGWITNGIYPVNY